MTDDPRARPDAPMESTPPVSAAHHAPGGGFRNPWPTGEPHGLGGVARWMAGRALGARRADPPPSALAHYVAPGFATPRAAADAIMATWVGHSTFLVQVGALNVLTDPVWGERASPLGWAGPKRWVRPGVPLADLPPIDVVVQSHDHYDHLDAGTVRRLAAEHGHACWVAPLGVGALLGSLGARTEELDWWQTTRVPLPGGGGALEITGVPAQHFSGRGLRDRDRTLWCGWAMRVVMDADAGAAARSAAGPGARCTSSATPGCTPTSPRSARGAGRWTSCSCPWARTTRGGSCARCTWRPRRPWPPTRR
jgi:hypothetical protein